MIGWAQQRALALIVVAGLALRVFPWLLPHSFLGVLEHDDGIYYGGAKLLLHGQLPYADFASVHPPGAALLLLPFALLGAATSDLVGLAAARVAVAVVAAISIILVHRLALRLPTAPGRERPTALAAAAVYAVFPNAVIAEHTVLLEPLVTLPCLLAVLLLTSDRGRPRRPAVLAGLLLALAISIKLFAGAYVLVVAVWLIAQRRARVLPWLAAGITAGAAALLLPFFAAAPQRFWDQVVITQLSRPRDSGFHPLERVVDMVGLGWVPWLGAVLLVAAVAEGWRQGRQERGSSSYWVWVGVLGVGGVAFAGAASYFPHYGAFLAPAVALIVTRGLARAQPDRVTRVVLRLLLIVFVAGSVADNARYRPQGDWQAMARLVPEGSCVFYESASVPLALDRLAVPTADCPAWLDARGLLYSWSTGWPADRSFYYEGFTTNQRWQAGVLDQLEQADHLLLKAAPQDIPEWAPATRAYASASFRRVLAFEGKDKATVELWSRISPRLSD